MKTCSWSNKGTYCGNLALNYTVEKSLPLCRRHRNATLNRGKKQLPLASPRMTNLSIGDIVKLVWRNSKILFSYAIITSKKPGSARARVLYTAAQLVDRTPYSMVFSNGPDLATKTYLRVKLLESGQIGVDKVAYRLFFDQLNAMKIPPNLQGVWGLWDQKPFITHLFYD